MPQAIVSFAFGSAFAASTGGLLLSSAIGLGLSIGLQVLTRELFGPDQPKPEDMQGLLRQSVQPRTRHYGRVRVGGAIVFIETKDGNLYQIVVHGQGPVDGYEQIYIDNRPVTLDANGGVVTDPYEPSKQKIESYLGPGNQTAIQTIVNEFPTIWTADHRLRSLACSMLYAESVDAEDVSEVYPNRIPMLNRVIRATQCYDPRTGTAAWTRNPAIIMRDYLTNFDGMKIPEELVDDELIKVAAHRCAQPVTTKAGETIQRYAIGLSYDFEQEPKNILNRIINACDGRLFITSEGKIGFQAGVWIEPTVTIDDDHVISYELTDGSGPFRESNEVVVKFTHVEVGYKEATSDPWRDEASISLLGEVRSNLLTAYEIQNHNHARRIAKIVQHRAAPRWQGTITTNLHGLNAWDQRWINYKNADLDIDGTFEIIGPPAVDTDRMTVTLQIQSFDAGVYDFDPVTEEGTGPTVPEELEEETIAEPTGVTTGAALRKLGEVTFTDSDTTTTVTQGGDGTVTHNENPSQAEQSQNINVYVATISWNEAPRSGLQADAQYSLNGTDWLGMAVAAHGTQAETGPMPRPSTVRLRVRWRTIGGAASQWVNGNNVNIPA